MLLHKIIGQKKNQDYAIENKYVFTSNFKSWISDLLFINHFFGNQLIRKIDN